MNINIMTSIIWKQKSLERFVEIDDSNLIDKERFKTYNGIMTICLSNVADFGPFLPFELRIDIN